MYATPKCRSSLLGIKNNGEFANVWICFLFTPKCRSKTTRSKINKSLFDIKFRNGFIWILVVSNPCDGNIKAILFKTYALKTAFQLRLYLKVTLNENRLKTALLWKMSIFFSSHWKNISIYLNFFWENTRWKWVCLIVLRQFQGVRNEFHFKKCANAKQMKNYDISFWNIFTNESWWLRIYHDLQRTGTALVWEHEYLLVQLRNVKRNSSQHHLNKFFAKKVVVKIKSNEFITWSMLL